MRLSYQVTIYTANKCQGDEPRVATETARVEETPQTPLPLLPRNLLKSNVSSYPNIVANL